VCELAQSAPSWRAESNNCSWSCGIEGPSSYPASEQFRNRQVKNYLAATLLSVGMPMLVIGDEVRRLIEKHTDVHRVSCPILRSSLIGPKSARSSCLSDAISNSTPCSRPSPNGIRQRVLGRCSYTEGSFWINHSIEALIPKVAASSTTSTSTTTRPRPRVTNIRWSRRLRVSLSAALDEILPDSGD
jgi:hypothetical protein